MDSSKVSSLLEQLDDEIDDLEEALEPLLQTALAETSSKLPLLDKAKLYTLVTYAIESILFSYLRLHGIQARGHSVFTELIRVKQYFEKIKMTEKPPARTLIIDKVATSRFLGQDLATAEQDALRAAELKAKEKARAHIKFEALNREIEERKNALKLQSERTHAHPVEQGKPQPVIESGSSDSDSEFSGSVVEASTPQKSDSAKKRKLESEAETGTISGLSDSTANPQKMSRRSKVERNKKAKSTGRKEKRKLKDVKREGKKKAN